MAPPPEPPRSICSSGEEIANAQGDNHEEIAREVVSVDEGSRNRRNPVGPIHIEDVAVAAEKFEYPVEGFENTNEENNNNKVIYYPVPVIRMLPAKEEDEEGCEGQPLEELDLGGEREKRQSSYE